LIYLDSAATSLIKPKSVKNAVYNAMNELSSPGRGSYRSAMIAADKVYECRELLSEMFNAGGAERVVFTSNATHALNIAIRSMARQGSRVLISGYEHNAVTRTLFNIGAEIRIAESPLFDTAAAAAAFSEKLGGCELCVCTHVSNVFGFILPIYEIAELCRSCGVPLIIDASQSAGVLPFDFGRTGAAFAAMPGHKGLLGPQGTGVLLCREIGAPLISGGTGSDSIEQLMPDYLPERLEAGTLNVCGIAGLCEGVRYIGSLGAERISEHEDRLRMRLCERLSGAEGIELFYTRGEAQSGVVSMRHSATDCESLCAMLGQLGTAARCGLHCAPLAHSTAGTLESGTLRLSFGPFTAEREVIEAAEQLKSIIHRKNN